MPKGYQFYLRKWLNPEGRHSTAFIYATVERSYNDELDGQIVISDCNKQITLAFDRKDKKKIETLISSFEAFKNAMYPKKEK